MFWFVTHPESFAEWMAPEIKQTNKILIIREGMAIALLAIRKEEAGSVTVEEIHWASMSGKKI